jgi:hypothetical protein
MKRGEKIMKKLIVLLMVVSFLLVGIISNVFAVIAPANVGPTTDFLGDVGVPTGGGYYVNDTLVLAADSLTFSGTGTLNGLDAVDATGEDTIEALIFDADAESILGVWEVADDVDLVFGTDANWAINYDESVDDQLIFLTAGTAAGAVTDPLFEIIVGATPTSNQEVFGVAKGTQASNTSLFSVDEDGDVLIPGTLGVTGVVTLTTALGADQGGTGVANNAGETLTFVGDDAVEFTTSGPTTVTLPTTGTLATTADLAAAGNHIDHFMDVDAADPDYVHVAIVGTGASQDVSTGITNPDFGRNITVTSTAGSVGVVTITGTTALGALNATDAITIVDGSIAYGVKAFVTVTKINTSVAFISPEEVTIGIGDVIGLSNGISEEADIYNKVVDGVNEFDEISTKGNATNETLDCATIVQNEDITIYYHP